MPGLAYDLYLKQCPEGIELLSDKNMINMITSGIRG